MTMAADGTGTITVIATADAELVAAVPEIAEELATGDIVAAGWTIDGPTATDAGGLRISMSHDFASDQEATNLLNSIGAPFNDMSVERNSSGDDTTTRVSGLLGLADGFEAFADDDLIAAVGAMPFADQIEAAGATPASAMTATIRIALPGTIDAEQTNGVRLDDGDREWTVPLDGEIVEWRALSVQSPGDSQWWARPLSIVALVLLVAWVVFMTLFIGYVVFARWQHSRHRP